MYLKGKKQNNDCELNADVNIVLETINQVFRKADKTFMYSKGEKQNNEACRILQPMWSDDECTLAKI